MTRSEALVRRLLEDEPPKPGFDVKAEIDKLMPTKTMTLKGNSMFNAAGMVNMAIREFSLPYAKSKKWAMKFLRLCGFSPDIVDKILSDKRTTVDANGDDAVITIHTYADPRLQKTRKIDQRPPAPE